MIKSEIANAVAKRLDIKGQDALKIVDATMESMKDTINEQGRLEIRDFGVFVTKNRRGNTGRNPRTMEEYPIPPRRVVKFRAGKNLVVDLDAEKSNTEESH